MLQWLKRSGHNIKGMYSMPTKQVKAIYVQAVSSMYEEQRSKHTPPIQAVHTPHSTAITKEIEAVV